MMMRHSITLLPTWLGVSKPLIGTVYFAHLGDTGSFGLPVCDQPAGKVIQTQARNSQRV